MPDLQQNLAVWNHDYDWRSGGEEWSRVWGGSEAQWFFSIYPRIHRFLPVNSLLEIAPGFGRWTQYLKKYCNRLSLVDLSDKCIAACRQRFQLDTFIEYHVNDGRSLEMIEDDSCDFIFSFDSLVHAEVDVLESYIRQMSRKLSQDGVAFLHHSNLAGLPESWQSDTRLTSLWRARNVSADLVRKIIEVNYLVCLSQEVVNWGTTECIDCFTLLARPRSKYERPYIFFENPHFMQQAEAIRRCSQVYTSQRSGAAESAWLAQLSRAKRKLLKLVTPGQMFILVDGNLSGLTEELKGHDRQPTPFVERDGQYWGQPVDDATAIRELERLRLAGSTLMIFAWPALWWLEHYSGMHKHLREHFQCIFADIDLVVFDLRALISDQT